MEGGLEDRIRAHYAPGPEGSLVAAILAAVGGSAADADTRTSSDLAPVDEFHVGGRRATVHLVDRLGLARGMHVLDVGSGIGGAARCVAQRFGCRVTGVDLTPEYCSAATQLADALGLADWVGFQVASVLDLPFEDGSFDAAYMLHVGMNLADKPAAWRELARVLAPDAPLGVYDLLAGDGGAPAFPVPWATDAGGSFLATLDEMRAGLEDAGLAVEAVESRAEFGREAVRELVARGAGRSREPGSPGIRLLLGQDAERKLANLLRNLEEDRCVPWEFVCRRRGGA